MNNLFWIFLSSGFLVGFGHCIGMCGPIVVSLSLGLKQKHGLIPHLLYNTGRVITYTVMGGIMGMTGSFTLAAANMAGIQKGAMIFAGVLVLVMGLAMSGLLPLGRIFGDTCNPGGVPGRWFHALSRSGTPPACLLMGLVLGLLPCGPVYTALIAAAGAGMNAPSLFHGIYTGAAVMLCFGLGTIPALLTVGTLTGLTRLRSRDLIYKAGAGIMMLAGVYFIYKGIKY